MEKNSDNLQRASYKSNYNRRKTLIHQVNGIVIKYKDTKIYQFIYNHPKGSIAFLIIWGLIILKLLIYFMYKLHHQTL